MGKMTAEQLAVKWHAEAVQYRQQAVATKSDRQRKVLCALAVASDDHAREILGDRPVIDACRCGHSHGDHQQRIGRGNYTPCCINKCLCDGYRTAGVGIRALA